MGQLVMIIDDSITVRKILEVILRREEIAFVSFPDGREALRALRGQAHPVPDVLILDVHLPKMDGYTFARLLRSSPRFDNMTIIMLSGYNGVLDRIKGRLAGARDYIAKPFRTQEIMAVVRKHLYSAPPATL